MDPGSGIRDPKTFDPESGGFRIPDHGSPIPTLIFTDMSTQHADLAALKASLDRDAIGAETHARIRRLYPICRSITGNGLRQTLRLIAEEIDLRTEEVPTGTPVFDWTVPKEWNIRDAYIKNRQGVRLVDFNASQSARRQLQRAGESAHDARRASAARALDSRTPGLDSLQDVLLRGELGLLRDASPARGAREGRWRARRLHRFLVGQRSPDAGPVRAGRPAIGRDPLLVSRVPSVALQRQPVRDLGGGDARAAA